MQTLIFKYACGGGGKRILVGKTALDKLASVLIQNDFQLESCISEKYPTRESNQAMVFIKDAYSVRTPILPTRVDMRAKDLI